MPEEARLFFEDALALFPTNEQVRERNLRMLESLHTPVACIEARYIDIDKTQGSAVKEEFCGGLQTRSVSQRWSKGMSVL